VTPLGATVKPLEWRYVEWEAPDINKTVCSKEGEHPKSIRIRGRRRMSELQRATLDKLHQSGTISGVGDERLADALHALR